MSAEAAGTGPHGTGRPDIGRHYDERSPIGDALRDGQIHMWYFYDDADDTPLPEAVHRITRRLADSLGLRPGERLLDAGCGPGETAVHLAREHGVDVTGVTLSSYEIAAANRRAAAAGVGHLVRAEHGDYAALPYPDGTFDAVLALESLQNAPDLPAVLAEFHRVLRPGGRVSFSDFSLESDAEPDRVARFVETLRLGALPTLPRWLELTRAAGFEVEEYTQCGPRVFGRKATYLRLALQRREELAAAFGDEAVAEFSRLHRGFFAPRRDQIGYVIVSARKPAR